MAIDGLVARAKHGEADAFAALYDRYAPPLYRYALARLHEPADAEDLVARVFLAMIEALPRYEDRGLPFGAWLFRIAHHALIDGARTRHPLSPLEAAADQPSSIVGPEAAAERAAERATLEAAIARLTPEQRDVIVYRFFAGLSPAEIGSLLGRREGAVRALQFRALGALRRELGAPDVTAAPDRPR